MFLSYLTAFMISAAISHASSDCRTEFARHEIHLKLGTVEAYDDLKSRVNLGALSGVETEFVFVDAEGQERSVIQTPYDRSEYQHQFPSESKVAQRLAGIYDLFAAELRHRLSSPLVLVKLLATQGRKFVADFKRIGPGETSQILFQIGDYEDVSEIRSWREALGSRRPDILTVNFDSSLFAHVFTVVLPDQIARDPEHVLVVSITLVHLHPGIAAPLSPADLDLLFEWEKKFAENLPFAALRIRMVAVAALEQQGDLVFVKDVYRPRIMRPKEFLAIKLHPDQSVDISAIHN